MYQDSNVLDLTIIYIDSYVVPLWPCLGLAKRSSDRLLFKSSKALRIAGRRPRHGTLAKGAKKGDAKDPLV